MAANLKEKCKICGGDCGQCGSPNTNPSYIWDKNKWNAQTLAYGDYVKNPDWRN